MPIALALAQNADWFSTAVDLAQLATGVAATVIALVAYFSSKGLTERQLAFELAKTRARITPRNPKVSTFEVGKEIILTWSIDNSGASLANSVSAVIWLQAVEPGQAAAMLGAAIPPSEKIVRFNDDGDFHIDVKLEPSTRVMLTDELLTELRNGQKELASVCHATYSDLMRNQYACRSVAVLELDKDAKPSFRFIGSTET